MRKRRKALGKAVSLGEKYIEALLFDGYSLMKQSALAVVRSGLIVSKNQGHQVIRSRKLILMLGLSI